MTVSENVAVIMYHYSCWLRVIMSSLHIVTSDITSLLHINIIVNDYDYIWLENNGHIIQVILWL